MRGTPTSGPRSWSTIRGALNNISVVCLDEGFGFQSTASAVTLAGGYGEGEGEWDDLKCMDMNNARVIQVGSKPSRATTSTLCAARLCAALADPNYQHAVGTPLESGALPQPTPGADARANEFMASIGGAAGSSANAHLIEVLGTEVFNDDGAGRVRYVRAHYPSPMAATIAAS